MTKVNTLYSPHTWYLWRALCILRKMQLSSHGQSLLAAIECVGRLRLAGIIDEPAYQEVNS